MPFGSWYVRSSGPSVTDIVVHVRIVSTKPIFDANNYLFVCNNPLHLQTQSLNLYFDEDIFYVPCVVVLLECSADDQLSDEHEKRNEKRHCFRLNPSRFELSFVGQFGESQLQSAGSFRLSGTGGGQYASRSYPKAIHRFLFW